MIEKKLTLPCGHEIEIKNSGIILKAIVSTKTSPENLGIYISEDRQNATIYAHPESLPVLRDLLIELAPLPSPATIFRENVIKIFNFLKGGKS